MRNGTGLVLGVVAGLTAAGLATRRVGSLKIQEDIEIKIEDHGGKAPIAFLLANGKQVGHAQASFVPSLAHDDLGEDCKDAIRELRRKTGPATLWTMWRSGIQSNYTGKGYGVALYEAMLHYLHEKHGKPAILFPEVCMIEGSTSMQAERVWMSLAKRWQHEPSSLGFVICSLPLHKSTESESVCMRN